jgi:hypothetical protein
MNIINLSKIKIINISKNENFYDKFRFRVVKFSNFEIPTDNYVTPLAQIPVPLINFKIRNEISFQII